jgi:RNA recognition motif-containing protein
MTMSMYVGNLPFSADETSLQSLFAPFGEVISARVMADRDTGRSRGFGFVEMASGDAQKAISALDGTEFEGRKLRINESEKRAKRPQRFSDKRSANLPPTAASLRATHEHV